MQAIAPLRRAIIFGQKGAGEIEGRKIGHLDHGERLLGVVSSRDIQRPAPALLISTSGVPASRAIRALDLLGCPGVGEIDRVRRSRCRRPCG